MPSETYVIASDRPWNADMARNLQNEGLGTFELITNSADLTLDRLSKINPKRIFIPHWSYIIPEQIFNRYEVIIFHMTDLPFGRGGSPLQNLILQGFHETKICAIRCVRDVDAGPVYLRAPLQLNGSANEIFVRASSIIEEMIADIIINNPTPKEQDGEVVRFKRRTPEQSRINYDILPQEFFDIVRMLDAPGYPLAYIEFEKFYVLCSNVEFGVNGDIEFRGRLVMKDSE